MSRHETNQENLHLKVLENGYSKNTSLQMQLSKYILYMSLFDEISLENYADGVVFIHLVNVEKHIKFWGLLDRRKNNYFGGSSSTTSNPWFF